MTSEPAADFVSTVWVVQKEEEERMRQQAITNAKTKEQDADARREEMRRQAGLSK